MKNKNNYDEMKSFEIFLKSSMTSLDFDQLPETLGLSKRMFTFILRDPKKMKFTHIKTLSDITKKPIESFAEFIS